MYFTFEPYTEAQLEEMKNAHLLKDGEYEFVVKEVFEEVSQAGNPMLKVLIGIYVERITYNIKDFLITTGKMSYKLRHFCESIGMGKQYQEGKFLTKDCINRKGRVLIGLDKGKPREDGTGNYPDRNKVVDYIKDANVASSKNSEFVDDDISF